MELDSATLEADEGTGFGSDSFQFAEDSLAFNERSIGIVLLGVEADGDLPASWRLTVSEKGGLEREVTVDGIQF
jgi:hypothetical protein